MLTSLLLRQRLMATSALLVFIAVSAQRVPARQEMKALEPADLELVISGPHEGTPDGPPLGFHPRKFRVTLVNHSSRPVVFGPNAVGAVPNYETTDWRVTDPKGTLVPLRPVYICKVGTPRFFPAERLTDESLSVISPGESRDLGDVDISMWFRLSEPGEYKIYREFSFSPPRLTPATIGGLNIPSPYDVSAMSPERIQLLRDAVGFIVKSNVWTLVIK